MKCNLYVWEVHQSMFSRDFFSAALMCPAVLNQYLIKLNEVCLWWNLKQIQNRFMCQWLSWKYRCSNKYGVSLCCQKSIFYGAFWSCFFSYILSVLAQYTPLSIHWTPSPTSILCGTDADRSTDNVAQCLLFVNDSAATVYIHRPECVF